MEDCRSKIPSNSEILMNICFIREVSLQFYKENNVNYDDTPSDLKTVLNLQHPKQLKRRPSAVERSGVKKPLNLLN
jgi:hypothetical protein